MKRKAIWVMTLMGLMAGLGGCEKAEPNKSSELLVDSSSSSSETVVNPDLSSSVSDGDNGGGGTEKPDAPEVDPDATPKEIFDAVVNYAAANNLTRTYTYGGVEYNDVVAKNRYLVDSRHKKGAVLLDSYDPDAYSYDYLAYNFTITDEGLYDVDGVAHYSYLGGYLPVYNMLLLNTFSNYMADPTWLKITEACLTKIDGLNDYFVTNSGGDEGGNGYYMQKALANIGLMESEGENFISVALNKDKSFTISFWYLDEYAEQGTLPTKVRDVWIHGADASKDPKIKGTFGDWYELPRRVHKYQLEKLFAEKVHLKTTTTIYSDDGSADPVAKNTYLVVNPDGYGIYEYTDTTDTTLADQNVILKGKTGKVATYYINGANEAVERETTKDFSAISYEKILNEKALRVNPNNPNEYIYFGVDAGTLLANLTGNSTSSYLYYGTVKSLKFEFKDDQVVGMKAVFDGGLDSLFVGTNQHAEMETTLLDPIDLVRPAPFEAIEGVTDKLQTAFAKFDGTTGLKITYETLNGENYATDCIAYMDADAEAYALERYSSGNTLSGVTGYRKESDEAGYIPYEVDLTNKTAEATKKNLTDFSFAKAMGLATSPNIYKLKEGTEDTYVLRDTSISLYGYLDFPNSSSFDANSVELHLDADGNLTEIDYAYNSGYFGNYKRRARIEYGATLPASYATAVNNVEPFVIPTTWNWQKKAYTSILSFFKTEEEANKLPFLYDENFSNSSFYAYTSSRSLNGTYCPGLRVYGSTTVKNQSYKEDYRTLLKQAGWTEKTEADGKTYYERGTYWIAIESPERPNSVSDFLFIYDTSALKTGE